MVFLASVLTKEDPNGSADFDPVCVIIANSKEEAKQLFSGSSLSGGITLVVEVSLLLADGVSLSGLTNNMANMASERSKQDETPQRGSIGGW